MAATWDVPGDAPTIQAGIDAASAGDDVLVAPGLYWEYDIAMKAGVWVHSEQGPTSTTVNAGGAGQGFTCTDLDQTRTIEGFTIMDGYAHWTEDFRYLGGGVNCVRSSVVIRDCVITGCVGEGGGVGAIYGSLEIEDCRVENCWGHSVGGGIWVATAGPVRIADCEIHNNGAMSCGGIFAASHELEVLRCVVTGNVAGYGSAGGIGCLGGSGFVIRDCLIANNTAEVFGEGSGIMIVDSAGVIDGCTLAGNISGPGQGSCDILDSQGDYTLDGNSPCFPGNHPDGVDCGLIGALGQGCGPTATEESTWGRIKMLFRIDGEKSRP